MPRPAAIHSPRFIGNRRAFSLVEILVAMGILVVLGALAIPAVTLVLERSKQTGCMANLRQIGSAWMMYAAEHDGTLGNYNESGDRYWGGKYSYWGGPKTEERTLYPYVSQTTVFKCPGDVPNSGGNSNATRNLYSICGNSYMVANSTQRGVIAMPIGSSGKSIPGKVYSIEAPSTTVLAFDATVTNKASNQTLYWHPHNTSNVLMIDGHVEVFTQQIVEAFQNPTNPPGYTWGWTAWNPHSQR